MKSHKHHEKSTLLRLGFVGVLFVACVLLSIYGLVSNSQGATSRYDALIAADQAGGDVEARLNELRAYIYSHMNTQIGSETGIKPPIQLQGTYQRLVATEQERVRGANEKLYAQAQSYCESISAPGQLRERAACVERYLDDNGGEKERPIEAAFYKFDFVPPRWSPDLAGISIVLSVLFGMVLAIDILLYYRTKHMITLGN